MNLVLADYLNYSFEIARSAHSHIPFTNFVDCKTIADLSGMA